MLPGTRRAGGRRAARVVEAGGRVVEGVRAGLDPGAGMPHAAATLPQGGHPGAGSTYPSLFCSCACTGLLDPLPGV